MLEFGNLLLVVREQAHAFDVLEGAGREDVSDVFSDDVGDEQVDLAGRLGCTPVRLGADVESAAGLGALAVSRFHLNSKRASAGLDDEIVAVAVAPRFGHADAHECGLGEESGFGVFAAAFGEVGADSPIVIPRSFATRNLLLLHTLPDPVLH